MSERRVPVIYQGMRKLVNVNFASFENVVSSIGQRLRINNDIELFGKRNENEEYFNINEDVDFEGLEDAEGLVLLVKDLSLGHGDPSRQRRVESDQATGHTSSCQDFPGEKDTASMGYRGSSSASMADEAGGPPYSPSDVAPGMPYQGYPTSSGDGMPYAVPVYEKPPEYAESIDADRSLGAHRPEPKITAIYGAKTKKIAVERSNFEAIHNLIANRFGLPSDFQLQVRDESGDMIDIDSNGDAADNIELMHSVWVIPADATAIKVEKREDMSLVKVGGVEYSIIETPDRTSKIVINAAADLQEDISIPSISAKLNEVAEYLRIAYYASMDDKELHKKTQGMQFDIQKLCAECDVTMLKIKVKSADILNDLQCGFGYLLEGFEKYGMERLGVVGPSAQEILKEVKRLTGGKNLLDNLSSGDKAVQKNLARVENLSTDESFIAAKAIERERQRTERQRVKLEYRTKAVSELESHIGSLAMKEQGAVQAAKQHVESDSGIGFCLMNLITYGFYEGNKSRAEQEERFAKEMREEQARERKRLDKLKEEEARAKIKLDALEAMIDAQPKKMAEIAIHGASNGFKTLGLALASLSAFWQSIVVQITSLNKRSDFLGQLRKESGHKENKSAWISMPFKIQALKYIARFVAIQVMCEEFHKNMTKVLEDIHLCIRDNPTPEEARKKLPELVKQLEKKKTEESRRHGRQAIRAAETSAPKPMYYFDD